MASGFTSAKYVITSSDAGKNPPHAERKYFNEELMETRQCQIIMRYMVEKLRSEKNNT